MSIRVLSVCFDHLTLASAADRAMELIRSGKSAYVCTPNPEIVWMCRSDPALDAAVDGADMTTADGTGILWAAKLLGQPLPERVTGYDLMTAVLERLSGRVYFLGGKPGVAQRAAQAVSARYPAVIPAGCRDGYFDDPAPVLTDILAAEPDLILVCLGSPKQELFMADARKTLPRGLMMGLGGSLDVLAGDVPRAPERWQKAGLEWLYRILRQPRRLVRLPKLAAFVLAVLGQKVKNRGS